MCMFDLSLNFDVEHDPLYMKNHYLHKNIKIINQNLREVSPYITWGFPCHIKCKFMHYC
jgi:hypothetical protein